MKTLHLVALTCVAIHGSVAHAQSTDVLQVKTRVRLTAPSIDQDRLTGLIEFRDSAAVVLLRDPYRMPVSVPITAIQVAERSLGHQRGRWAAAGLGLGIAGGIIGGAVVANADRNSSGGANLAPVGGAFLGILLGPIIGAAAAPERWQAVPISGRP